MKAIYPRYFVCSESCIRESGGESTIWLKFAVVNKKGGKIKFYAKPGIIAGEKAGNEIEADQFVKEGDWREILPQELALIIN